MRNTTELKFNDLHLLTDTIVLTFGGSRALFHRRGLWRVPEDCW